MIDKITKVIKEEKFDKEEEMFWLDIKNNLIIFNKKYNLDLKIELWSDILNNFQEKKEVNLINKYIRVYLAIYCLKVIEFNDGYHISLLFNKIKKWNTNSSYNFIDSEEYNLIFELLKIKKNNIENKDLQISEKISIETILENEGIKKEELFPEED